MYKFYERLCGNRLAFSIMLLLILTGCDRGDTDSMIITPDDAISSHNEAPDNKSHHLTVTISKLSYMEAEAGTEPYPVRILVSPDYVRLDDGYDESDYVLLDRKSRTLVSVTHENRSVLIINNQALHGSLPDAIALTEESLPDNEAPTISGKRPLHFRYLADNTVCRESVSVKGVMSRAVSGMREFATALGERQSNNMHSVPVSMQTPCFLSRYVFAAGRIFDNGLPIQSWDNSGFSRTLIDFSDEASVPAAVFSIPDDYQSMTL